MRDTMRNSNVLPESPKLNNLSDFDREFPNEQACRDMFEKIRWNGKIICPHCKSDKTSKFKNGKLYWCKACSKQFTVRVKTIFEDSALPLRKWFYAIYLLTSRKKGLSSVQLGKDIGVTQKTAWFMLHRIRYAVRTRSLEKPLEGTVEVDETFVGGKSHGFGRGYCQPNKTAVFGMKQRDGIVRAQTVARANRKNILPIIGDSVSPDATIMSDEFQVYAGLKYEFKNHEVVIHSKKEYVRGNVHTNGIESFWALFKRGYVGTYHWMSRKHLDKYIDEFEYRMNSKGLSDAERFATTFSFVEGRLTYNQLISE